MMVVYFGIVLMLRYGSAIAGEILKGMISSQSNGLYTLSYKELEISPLDLVIQAEELSIRRLSSSDTSRYSYQLDIPHTEISIHSFWDIYFQSALEFKGILVRDPEVIVYKKEVSGDVSTFTLETGTIYQSISSYLSILKIDSLSVENGSVHFSKQSDSGVFNFLLNEIRLDLKNFLIDEASENERFLFTDNIELVITNQHFLLADSVHELKFEEFSLSTSTREVFFRNLSITHPSRKLVKGFGLNVRIPKLGFSGVDFESAYKNNVVLMDSIWLYKPEIELEIVQEDQNTSDPQRSNPITLLTSIFPNVHIPRLFMEEGHVTVSYQSPDVQVKTISREVNLEVYTLRLDSTSNLSKPDRLMEHYHLSVSSTNAVIDSTYSLSLELADFRSSSNTLNLNKVSLIPINRRRSELQALSLEKVELKGFNDMLFKEGKGIEIEMARLIDPKVEWISQKPSGIPLIPTIRIRKLQVLNGEVSAQNPDFSANSQNINILALNLDVTKDKLTSLSLSELASTLSITSGRSQFSNAEVQVTYSHLDTDNFVDFGFENLQVKNATKNTFSTGKLKLSGIDLPLYLTSRFLRFDSVRFTKPIIKLVETDTSGLSTEFLRNLQFSNAKIEMGNFTKSLHGKPEIEASDFDVVITDYKFDSIQLTYQLLIGLHTDSLYVRLPGLNHTLAVKQLHITPDDSTIYCRKIQVTPLTTNQANALHFSSKGIRLHKVNFMSLLNEQDLIFYNAYLISPQIRLSLKPVSGHSAPAFQSSFNLRFSHLNISDAEVDILGGSGDSTFQFLAKKLNLLISGFDLSNDTLLFHASNYLTDAQTISFQTPHLNPVQISKASYNTRSGNLLMEGIRHQHATLGSLFLDQLKLKGLDSEKLGKNQELDADSLVLIRPVFNLNDPSGNKKNPAIAEFPISLKYFKIQDATLRILIPEVNRGDSLTIPHIQFGIEDIRLAKGESMEALWPKIDEAQIALGPVTYQSEDGLYTSSLNTAIYDGSKRRLELLDFHLRPNFNRKEFQNHIPYQKDRFDIYATSALLKNFKPYYMLNNEFTASKIEIQSLTVDTHRDKRIVMPPFIEKPLPQSMLLQLPFLVDVDTMKVTNAYISHSEFSEKGTKPGSIFFKNVNASFYNLTNNPALIQQDSIMRFVSEGILMNTGNFNLSIDFNLISNDDQYQLRGKMGNMDLTELNMLLENTANVHVKSGVNKLVTFDYTANAAYSVGEMKFYYDHLKISILKNEENQVQESGFKSFFANTFVVKKKNPHLLVVRLGNIFHERDPSKSIFNSWAKSLLSGVVTSIGVGNNKKEIRKLYRMQKEELDKKRKESRKPEEEE